MIATILLVLYLYYVNRQDVVSQFQQGQLRYAKSMALFLTSHFQPAAEGMPDDIKRLLTDQASLAIDSLGSKRIWIIDRKGNLLFHPTHEQMVPRNIYQKNETVLDEIARTISEMSRDEIKFEICLIAAKVFGVDPASVLPEFQHVGNGWISSIGYQAKGYSLVPAY